MQSSVSFFYKAHKPLTQVLVILGMAFILMAVTKLLNLTHIIHTTGRIYWLFSGALMLYFAIFNSIFSLSSSNFNTYFLHSVVGYVVIAIAASTFAFLFSSMTIDEAGTFRWIYVVLTMGYILFMLIVRSMQQIVTFAQKEDKKIQDTM